MIIRCRRWRTVRCWCACCERGSAKPTCSSFAATWDFAECSATSLSASRSRGRSRVGASSAKSIAVAGGVRRVWPDGRPIVRSVIGILNHEGAFADFVAVPQRNLYVVPDSVATDLAVFTEPLAAAFQIPAKLPLRREDRVVVLGDGRLGNLCAQVLASLCDRVLVIGKHTAKLAILRKLGLETCLLEDRPRERLADVVVDCTGSESGLPTALELVRPRGTVVLKTTVAGTQSMPWAPIVIDEVRIVGSRCGPFDRALAALERGEVQVQPLISDRFKLSNGLAALERAQSKDALKILLDVERD